MDALPSLVLREHLLPRLRLQDIAALRHTCLTLRDAIDDQVSRRQPVSDSLQCRGGKVLSTW